MITPASNQPGFRAVLAFAWRHWRRRPGLLVILGLGIAGATLAEIGGPVFIGRMIDALGADAPAAAFSELGAVIALRVVFHLFHKGGDYLWCRVAMAIMRRIGADTFARVQRYSTEWHASSFAGATVRKITRGIWAFDDLGDGLYFHLLPAAAVVAGVTAVMTVRWPAMGGLFVIGIALYTYVSVHLTAAYVSPRRRAAVEVDSKLGGALADALTCNAVVKSAGAEKREERHLGGVLDHWQARMIRAWRASVDTAVAQAVTMLLVNAVLVGSALWLWRQGQASPGDVAFVLASFFLVDGYLREVGNHIRMVQQAVNDLEDVVAFDRTPPAIVDRPGAPALAVRAGAISFEQVAFTYQGQTEPVFDGLDLAIRPGEKIALVGHSGSGKTTLVKLLQRLYDLDRGRITIDGQDIALVAQASLRAAIALVPQEPILFHRSLAENIAYGRPEAGAAEIERTARLAHADDFIEALPEGYATLVGERGVKLSGGERQRVAIARAILADRPILILDEATSALDSISEGAIQDALRHLIQGRTTIVIAHRLATIRQVDRILVFEHGRIVEQGSHDHLLARPDGYYRQLYATQAGQFAHRLAG